MNSIQLRTFAAVARKRSFTQAAQEVHLSQSTVSFHIRSLEQEFGVKLFDRAGREVTLTRAGELLRDYGRQIQDLETAAHQAIDDFQGLMRGELRIGASTIPGEYIAPPLLGAFRKEYPEVAVSLHIADSAGIIAGVQSGDLEFGLVGAEMKKETLIFEPFAQDELVLIAAPGERESDPPNTIRDVLSRPLLLREPGSGTRSALEQTLAPQELTLDDFNLAMELGSTQAIKAGVRAGLGVSFVSAWAVQDECQWGLLEILPLSDFTVRRPFFLTHRAHRSRSPADTAFTHFLQDNTPSLPSSGTA